MEIAKSRVVLPSALPLSSRERGKHASKGASRTHDTGRLAHQL